MKFNTTDKKPLYNIELIFNEFVNTFIETELKKIS